MSRHVCLLRGVNVGGKNRLAMTALRGLFEELGFSEVATYIQSGNVVFSAVHRPDPGALESAIERSFGLSVGAVVRSAAELRRALAANPFADRPAGALHVGVLPAAAPARLVRQLDPEAGAPDLFCVRRGEIFLFLPAGMGRTKLVGYLERRLGPATFRNWRTVAALSEMAVG